MFFFGGGRGGIKFSEKNAKLFRSVNSDLAVRKYMNKTSVESFNVSCRWEFHQEMQRTKIQTFSRGHAPRTPQKVLSLLLDGPYPPTDTPNVLAYSRSAHDRKIHFEMLRNNKTTLKACYVKYSTRTSTLMLWSPTLFHCSLPTTHLKQILAKPRYKQRLDTFLACSRT